MAKMGFIRNFRITPSNTCYQVCYLLRYKITVMEQDIGVSTINKTKH